MGEETYEALRRRISEDLNSRKREFSKCIGDISRNFRDLGLETAVWHPERIHSVNIGGLNAESYVGYSRIEGRWSLNIRTIERDSGGHAFVSQRVYALETCGNVEIVVNALKKARELLRLIAKTADQSIEILAKMDKEINQLRNPDCKF
ncbi:MAG: hypothetical protein JXA73_24290 [Acidobacteria bacterium]|nr:hypothetical protein [Acidobacteriota bacterium]